MHEHNDCQHEFKYCRICDMIYCEKCQKEWKYFAPVSYGSWTTITPPLVGTDGTLHGHKG